MKNLNLGIATGDKRISILLHANDIGVLAEGEYDLQSMVNLYLDWCLKWRLFSDHFRGIKKSNYEI